MKKVFRTISLFAMMGLLATSCQKEELTYPAPAAVQNADSVTIVYTINGESRQISFEDDSYRDFISYLVYLANNGSSVSFYMGNSGRNTVAVKETIVHVTPSADEAVEWSIHMAQQGYSVTIVFDDKTHLYTCTAVRNP